MSAVLGPIHHVMYERIRLTATRQEDLAEFARAQMSPGQREELEARWTLRQSPPAGDLALQIGDQPIHSWLQALMESVLLSEAQLWALLADRPERRAFLLGRLRDHGRAVGEIQLREVGADARRLLQVIDRVLLTSMPCDRVSEVLAAGERAFIVRRDLLFHAPLWERAGLSEELALAAHEAWLQGLCSACADARLVRAEVRVDGRRVFDDRLSLQVGEAQHGS
jgi:hypothetical protein